MKQWYLLFQRLKREKLTGLLQVNNDSRAPFSNLHFECRLLWSSELVWKSIHFNNKSSGSPIELQEYERDPRQVFFEDLSRKHESFESEELIMTTRENARFKNWMISAWKSCRPVALGVCSQSRRFRKDDWMDCSFQPHLHIFKNISSTWEGNWSGWKSEYTQTAQENKSFWQNTEATKTHRAKFKITAQERD